MACSPFMPNSAIAAPMAPMSAASFSTGGFGGRSSALRGGGGGGGLHSQVCVYGYMDIWMYGCIYALLGHLFIHCVWLLGCVACLLCN